MLPQAFLDRMKKVLGGEYDAFAASFEKERYQALRVNTLKTTAEWVRENSPFQLEQVCWSQNGWYYQASDQPGKHPYHEAG